MIDGITVKVLGDYGPFSRFGKSIGYQVTIGNSSFLLDCGAPLFQQIGGHGLKSIQGLIITHCHDDHKRWFSDLALFNMYAPDIPNKVFLLTSEDIHKDLIRASSPALERSLSVDSKRVVDISYEDYVDFRILGPRAKYRIAAHDERNGTSHFFVSDIVGNRVGPDVAKIVISKRTGSKRLLFKDPDSGEWIEPESFYPFSSEAFYEKNSNLYRDPEGFTIEAINAPVWHGVPSIGLKFKTDRETLVFSADTAHDTVLWKQLCSEKLIQRFPVSMTKEMFEAAPVIYGDINDYIERVWSEERYNEAVRAFDDAIVIHDIAIRNSVVHTDYRKLDQTVLKKEKVILTHSPDTMTSEWVLSKADKSFRITGGAFFEVVGEELYRLNADIYHKEAGRYYVGFKNESGKYSVCENDGLLSLSLHGNPNTGSSCYNVDLYENIGGKYFPVLDNNGTSYVERSDGRVEIVESTEDGSRGRVVENHRERLSKL